MQQVRPHHGDTLLDGGAQSVRYGGRLHDGSGQPDSADSQGVADSEIFAMGNDAAEFVNKVKDQVRKRQKRMSNVADSGEEHSDLTLKKIFDITVKLVGEQDEIPNVDTIRWDKHSWKHLSLIGDETVIRLLGFCVVSWKGSSTSKCQQSLERKDRMDRH